MKNNQIVADGLFRLLKGQRVKNSPSPDKYQSELAKAGPGEKRLIYERMEQELDRHHKMVNHTPSGRALW